MSTTSSIGTTSRNYSTIAAWNSAFTTGGWIGQCYNDSEFLVTSTITISAATNASDFYTLQTAAGQGFKDNVNAQTNGLPGYNQTNGVGVRTTTGYTSIISNASTDYVTIQYIQWYCANTGSGGNSSFFAVRFFSTAQTHCIIDSNVMQNTGPGTTADPPFEMSSGTVINNFILALSNKSGMQTSTPGTLILCNNTIVCPASVGNTQAAFKTANGGLTVTAINNCWFGFTSFQSAAAVFSGNNNASDLAISFGSANQASLTYSAQFNNSASNWIPASSGSALVDNGATATTQIPAAIDIVGTSRPQGSAWDIGCWELKSGAPPATKHQMTTMGAG